MAKRDLTLGVAGADTMIGAGVKLKGNLHSESDISIDGQLQGDIKSAGSVTVGVNAVIKANILARNVSIAGTVDGNVTAEGDTKITETGRLKGNVTTGSVSIDAGAVYSGTIIMTAADLGLDRKDDSLADLAS